MRKLRRTPNFELTLEIKNDAFIAPPRESQRNWLLNKAVSEFAMDLNQLDALAKRFVPGIDAVHIEEREQSDLLDEEIMEDWQIPLMRAMAEAGAAGGGDVLEIGFGRGVASTFIQDHAPRSHTVVECNDSVVARFHAWRAQWPQRDLRLIHGKWQDTIDQFGQYDGIFFHTYPLDEDEYADTVLASVTFAEHFFDTAAAHLRPGGVFTYMSNEIDSLSRPHQRALLARFSAAQISLVKLDVPTDVRDTWWSDQMVVVKAVK